MAMAMVMAGTNCRSLPLALKSVPSLQTNPLSRIFMFKSTKSSVNRILTLQIASSLKNNLVFEDRSNGVICYRDDDGEIICEGYDDEEPPIEKLSYRRSDGELEIDRLLLQRSWEKRLEIVNGGGGNGSGSGRGDVRIRANDLAV